MTRHKDLQAIIDKGGCLDDIATVSGCIVSHNLSLDMDDETIRERLKPLAYIAEIDTEVFRMILAFLRDRSAAQRQRLPLP